MVVVLNAPNPCGNKDVISTDFIENTLDNIGVQAYINGIEL